MTINQRIKAAVTPLVPVCVATIYQGNEPEYCTFNYNSVPALFADDEPAHEIYLIQVHLYAPIGYDTLRLRRDIKKALHSAGMTWPTYTNASDKDGQHHVFECEIAQEAGAE